jgi:hypothetical protein
MSHRTIIFLVAAVFASQPASAQQPAKNASAEQIEFFEKRIRPLFVHHCYECHSQSAKKLQGKLLLDSRAGLLKGGRSGAAIVPGKPQESLLIQAVRHEDKDLRMPPKSKLSAQEITDLETWIKTGAATPIDRATSPDRKGGGFDFAEAKKYWAFQPLKVTAPPRVNDTAWPRSDIDRFILATLEAKSMKPVRDAEPRALLRRVTFDLTGLPPTPEEVERFANAWRDAGAKRGELWEQTIDRLLASTAYGERWGRHWLDVVRYADTAGDNSDYPIPQNYLYRNWVIDAFNRDMPYDRFVREQLAGDLLVGEPRTSAQDDQQKIIATGYLANSRRHGSYEDARYPWHLTIEDTIDNLGKTFLGLTIHCARCHDHKFDPILQEDYYALYGFFSSTRYPWPGIELDRAQRDLIPLAAPAEVEKVMSARNKKLAEFEATIKKLEADKSPIEKIKTAKSERDQFDKQPLPFATAYAVMDGKNEPKKRIGQVGNAKVQVKGEPDRLGKEVPRRFPLILGGQTLPAEVRSSGRLELANWITDPANPLTARVMVNRIWQYHFGQGIVPTANDFGRQGRPSSHPELLDYLAKKFIDSGWSIKTMHKTILLSRAYQLASDDNEANLKLDPDNQYLWHFARRRLDAESIRDALLAVSGNLDRTPGGPHPFPPQPKWDFTQHKPFKAVYETNRRSVYLMTQRFARHPFLALFDGPDTNASTATRTTTTTPLQALFLMNDPFVHEQARKLAARLLKEDTRDDARIERAFLLTFGRPPNAEERAQTAGYVAEVRAKLGATKMSADQARERAWESFARVLFMSNEFVFVN